MQQTAIDNIIKNLFAKLNDKFDNQYEKLEPIIAKKKAKIDNKIKEELQPMSLQITEMSSKKSNQDMLL